MIRKSLLKDIKLMIYLEIIHSNGLHLAFWFIYSQSHHTWDNISLLLESNICTNYWTCAQLTMIAAEMAHILVHRDLQPIHMLKNDKYSSVSFNKRCDQILFGIFFWIH